MDGEAPAFAIAIAPSADFVGPAGSERATDPLPEAEIAPPPAPPPPADEEATDSPPLLPQDDIFADTSAVEGEGGCGGGGAVLTDELRDRIVKQVEYYFSDENLPTDVYLLKFVKKNKEGFVPIGLIASFRRMKKLVQDLSIIEAALRTSSQLVVSSDGKKVRRLHPLPFSEMKDVKKRTVLVENLPEVFSKESIQRIFGNIGNIINITIRDPRSVEGSTTDRKTDFVISSKVHALVEYESVEAAEKAVATLNDEKNWRSGMRVGLLSKRMVVGFGKHSQFLREEETISKRNNDTDQGESGLDAGKMDEEQRASSKGGRRSRYKGQWKGHTQHQQNASGQGHGSVPASSGSEFISKPIPGPRMPDGTRGFTMGRGKSLRPEEKTDKIEV